MDDLAKPNGNFGGQVERVCDSIYKKKLFTQSCQFMLTNYIVHPNILIDFYVSLFLRLDSTYMVFASGSECYYLFT